MRTKLCIVCQIEKPLKDFYVDKHKRDGRDTYCAACRREYRKLSPEEREDWWPVKGSRVELICKNCSSTFEVIPSLKSERAFCSDNCREVDRDRRRKNVECDWCGEQIERKISAINENNFCSRKCQGRWNSEFKSGKNSPLWKGGKKDFTCAVCNKHVRRWPSHVRGLVFCSNSCLYTWQSENIHGERHPSFKGGYITCDYCGKVKQRSPSLIEPWSRNFCDLSCYGKWISDNVNGENHPNWKGGYEPYYGPNWHQQRRKARKRDNYTCQDCGVTEAEIERDLDVHHKRPFRKFGLERYREANALSNLVSLCKTCHGLNEQSSDCA